MGSTWLRITEISGLALEDPAVRLVCELLLTTEPTTEPLRTTSA